MNVKMAIIGGTFDKDGGKESFFIKKLGNAFSCPVINGGYINELYKFRPHDIEVLIWMPNVDNSEDKILPRLKVMSPKTILISSKRVIEKLYTKYELITRLLVSKSNLGIVIDKKDDQYKFTIIDPLGNMFCDDKNFNEMIPVLSKRINELRQVKRLGSKQAEFDLAPELKSEISNDFLDVVKNFGYAFSNVIQANNPKRFLGNASTRCEWGFPSKREVGHALVSKRNVDKENITKYDFVKAYLTNARVYYHGKNKPSVDTPIQLKLYHHFKNINYIIHGHCYLENVDFTKSKLPCGDLNEVKEIIDTVDNKDSYFFAINLLGHGCIIASNEMKNLYNVKLKSRKLFEE